MKNKDLNLKFLKDLPESLKDEIELKNQQLVNNTGACLSFSEPVNDTITVQVKNINGKRTSKVELLNMTHEILSEYIPEKFRVLIKL